MTEKAAEELYTLTQVSEATEISMPTLQRYKKLYQNRIPSKGKGRSQRYPKEALDVFRELKKENIGRRGRPRKTEAAKKPRKSQRSTAAAKPKRAAAKKAEAPKKAAASKADGLLTLTQIGKLTGISYPTLLRYVKTNLKDIPHKGSGRMRRFLPDAVDVFKRLRGESRRGRQKAADSAPKAKAAVGRKAKAKTKAKTKATRGRKAAAATATTAAIPADLMARIKDLEKANKDLVKAMAKLEKQVSKPFRITLQR